MLNGENVLCIYQDNNLDSFLGAWVIWKTYPNATFIHRIEQTLPSDIEGKDVYVVGPSIPLSNILPMSHFCNTLTIFGFERTFETEMGEVEVPSNVNLVCNSQRCLSTIVWHFFNTNQMVPPLMTYVEDKTLWRYQYPETRPVTAALMGYALNFETWDNLLLGGDIQSLVDEGRVILRRQNRDVEQTLKIGQRRINLGGYDIPVVNASPLISADTGLVLAKGEPFAACYWDTQDGREYDLIACNDGIDVSELVRVFGGHGSRFEARFKVPKGHPLSMA